MAINRWWADDTAERYWLEITDRADLGKDLHSPQRLENGREYWSYSLIRGIEDGDVVFHYHTDPEAIVAWSLASGEVWEDETIWAAHGTVARSAGVQPFARDGWYLGLQNTAWLENPVRTEEIRSKEAAIRNIHESLGAAHGGSLYFPFAISDKRPLRASQGYLTKFPLALVKLFDPLATASAAAAKIRISPSPTKSAPAPGDTAGIGGPYRRAAKEVSVAKSDPFSVDPALKERALEAHRRTQDALAAEIENHGNTPRSPVSGEPDFDIAWIEGDVIYVVEVKSLTKKNEEKQLRYGLGQVLRYRHRLSAAGTEVKAILAVEREPSDEGWKELALALEIRLVWPGRFPELFIP